MLHMPKERFLLESLQVYHSFDSPERWYAYVRLFCIYPRYPVSWQSLSCNDSGITGWTWAIGSINSRITDFYISKRMFGCNITPFRENVHGFEQSVFFRSWLRETWTLNRRRNLGHFVIVSLCGDAIIGHDVMGQNEFITIIFGVIKKNLLIDTRHVYNLAELKYLPCFLIWRSLLVLDVFLMPIKALPFGVTRGVMVIVVGNGHGDMSSNPGWDWLHFHIELIPLGKVWIQLFSLQL